MSATCVLIHGAGDSGWYWQSFGGYIAPIVCDRVLANLLVLVAGMVPSPGESAVGERMVAYLQDLASAVAA